MLSVIYIVISPMFTCDLYRYITHKHKAIHFVISPMLVPLQANIGAASKNRNTCARARTVFNYLKSLTFFQNQTHPPYAQKPRSAPAFGWPKNVK